MLTHISTPQGLQNWGLRDNFKQTYMYILNRDYETMLGLFNQGLCTRTIYTGDYAPGDYQLETTKSPHTPSLARGLRSSRLIVPLVPEGTKAL